MSKTFTCRELGGVCEEKFSGDTLMEIVQKAMPHISDETPGAACLSLRFTIFGINTNNQSIFSLAIMLHHNL